jgi:hypothetical protein
MDNEGGGREKLEKAGRGVFSEASRKKVAC